MQPKSRPILLFIAAVVGLFDGRASSPAGTHEYVICPADGPSENQCPPVDRGTIHDRRVVWVDDEAHVIYGCPRHSEPCWLMVRPDGLQIGPACWERVVGGPDKCRGIDRWESPEAPLQVMSIYPIWAAKAKALLAANASTTGPASLPPTEAIAEMTTTSAAEEHHDSNTTVMPEETSTEQSNPATTTESLSPATTIPSTTTPPSLITTAATTTRPTTTATTTTRAAPTTTTISPTTRTTVVTKCPDVAPTTSSVSTTTQPPPPPPSSSAAAAPPSTTAALLLLLLLLAVVVQWPC